MRRDHEETFLGAADKCTCWIGLREPNPLSDRWIGRAGYIAKPESCKAKTADNPQFRLAGLVVDPIVEPAAFKRGTLYQAVDTWKTKFLVGGRLPTGYSCVSTGPEKGLVKLDGSAIFADYDLMTIVRSNDRGDWLFTSEAEQRTLFATLEPLLARGLGMKMIQHPTEFMWKGGLGARETERVLWFGPGRRRYDGVSSMPRAGH